MDVPLRELCFCSATQPYSSFWHPWTIAHQAPLSMGFSSQEYWRGLPFPPPGDLPRSEIAPTSPALAGWLLIAEPPGKPLDKLRLPQQSTADRVADAEMHALTGPELGVPYRSGSMAVFFGQRPSRWLAIAHLLRASSPGKGEGESWRDTHTRKERGTLVSPLLRALIPVDQDLHLRLHFSFYFSKGPNSRYNHIEG